MYRLCYNIGLTSEIKTSNNINHIDNEENEDDDYYADDDDDDNRNLDEGIGVWR